MGYTYEIHYEPGRENIVADALSQIPEVSAMMIFANISSVAPPLFLELQQFYSSHPVGLKLVIKAQSDSEMQGKFSYTGGLLYFKDRMFIPQDLGLSPSLLAEFHESPVGGHSGIKATLARLSDSFHWLGMHKAVKDFVNKYATPANFTNTIHIFLMVICNP